MSAALKIVAPVVVAVVGFGAAWAVLTDVLAADTAGLIMAAVTMLAAIIVAFAEARKKTSVANSPVIGLTAAQRRVLIRRIRVQWIGERNDRGELVGEGKLARDLSLGGELKVLLGNRLSEATSTSSPSSSVVEAWEASGNNLVLLGAAGAGKSVQLLLLTEQLLGAAEANPDAEVPVIVGLASWRPPTHEPTQNEKQARGRKEKKKKKKKKKRAFMRDERQGQPFEDWIVNEVARNYALGAEQVRDAIRKGSLLPILDGLDEVAHDIRVAHFEDMRNWITDTRHPPISWILASRPEEYDELDHDRQLAMSRASYWRVEPINDDVRISFLSQVAERTGVDWSAVIAALESGAAPHLTEQSQFGPGPLETPLGLAIAAEAYASVDAVDISDPAELLDQSEGWERLWGHYTRRRAAMTNVGGARTEAAVELRSADCLRWLANLASGRLGPTRDLHSKYLVAPARPAFWSAIADWIEFEVDDIFEGLDEINDREALRGIFDDDLDFFGSSWIATWVTPLHALGFIGLGVSFVFAWFAGVAGFVFAMVGIGGLIGHIAMGFCVISGLVVALAMLLFGYRWPVVVIPMCGAFAYAGADIGQSVANLLRSAIRSIADWVRSVTANWTDGLAGSWLDREARPWLKGDVGPWLVRVADGFFAGAFAVLIAYLIGLLVVLILYQLGHRRVEAEATYYSRFERLYNSRILVRWFHCGSPVRCSSAIDLVPSVQDWDRFLDWATHHGFLREVGTERLWMHETLRTWFGSQADEAALDTIQAKRREEPEIDASDADELLT